MKKPSKKEIAEKIATDLKLSLNQKFIANEHLKCDKKTCLKIVRSFLKKTGASKVFDTRKIKFNMKTGVITLVSRLPIEFITSKVTTELP